MIDGGEKEKEPYMATVQASRVQGKVDLFDSEHTHSNFIALRIHAAERQRALSSDWIFSTREIIEVYMSESQWATMISTLNFGRGTPATLQHMNGQRVDQPERADERTDLHVEEMKKTMQEAVSKLVRLKETRLTKGQMKDIDLVIQDIRANMPYVTRCFSEHMETRVDKAKADVEAYMNSAVQRAGLEVLIAGGDVARLSKHE